MLALQTAKMVSNGVSTSLAVALFVLLQSAALVSSVCPACMCPPNACDGGYASASVPNGIISVNYQFQVPDVPALDPNGNNPQFLFGTSEFCMRATRRGQTVTYFVRVSYLCQRWGVIHPQSTARVLY